MSEPDEWFPWDDPEFVAGARIAELKSRLISTNPIEQPAEHARLFAELIAHETYRRSLRKRHRP